MMNKIIFGLIIMVLLSGIVNAECERKKEKLDISMNDYNTIGVGYIDGYNKGNNGSACTANTVISDVWLAYLGLSRCYYEAGNRSLALELVDKAEEWGEKNIEWGGKCGGKSREDEEKADVYGMYVYFYVALKEHDCNILNKSASECFTIYNDNSNKSCYYCKEQNKYTKIVKMECKYYGCPPEDSQSANSMSDAGNKGEGIPVAPIAIGGIIVLILIVSAFFLLKKGKKCKVR